MSGERRIAVTRNTIVDPYNIKRCIHAEFTNQASLSLSPAQSRINPNVASASCRLPDHLCPSGALHYSVRTARARTTCDHTIIVWGSGPLQFHCRLTLTGAWLH
jgi:uncharacterized Fe-S cluster protein YjdI